MSASLASGIDVKSTRRRKYPEGPTMNGTKTVLTKGLEDDKRSNIGSFQVFAVVFLFYGVMFFFISYRSYSFPEPKFYTEGMPNDTFYESKARVHLRELTANGPRVVGSPANEEQAYGYILEEVNKLRNNVALPKEMEIDEQLTSGSFDIAFLSDFVSIYKNIKNIVVKLKGSKKGSRHSVLLSCHFDSAVSSPGAGDNAISCATMLEILRAISQSNHSVKHNMIFLFNGAEENMLQASHGFITQHPWAKSIRAFVNVDSAGAGGWDIVFQTGPSHPWLVRTYAESIPYPSGSIFGQELFQSGLVPSDTDFRIFRDFGDIPGLDIAYISNGYVYHTRNDQERFIETGCVQRSGENLMALLLELSNSDSLEHPGDEGEGTMIFFDIVGFVMLRYSENVAVVVNSALVATILFKVIRKTFHLDKSESQDVKYFKNLSTAVLYITMTWIVIFVTCFAMALLVTALGRNMSWYTYKSNIVPIFILPSFISVCLLHQFFKHSPLKNQSGAYSEQMFFDGNILIWSIFTLYLTVKGIGSAFFPMLYVIGPLTVRESITTVFKNISWKSYPYTFLGIHMLSLLIPNLITFYLGHAVLILFIPIMGRTGSELNTDIAVGIIIAALFIMVSGYLIGLCYICDNMKKLLCVVFGVICVWLAVIVFTPIGFSYSGDFNRPSPMRLLAFHTERRFHDITGSKISEDSGLWFLPFDFSKNQHLVEVMPELRNASGFDCSLGPYCALPYLIPVITLLPPKGSLYLPIAKLNRPTLSLKLMNMQEDGIGLTKMSFEVNGDVDHVTMQIRPKDGVSLELWSFSPLKPEPAAMPPEIDEITYYVYYSHGRKPEKPWTFSLHFKVADSVPIDKGIVEIGISEQFLHGKYQITDELQAFLDRVPDWVTPMAWTISYDMHVF